jgi:putative hydrolase of HD superfamily
MNRNVRAERLRQQIAFLTEVDKLKTVLRRTPLTDSSRRENSAEHSWHLIVAALVLREYADAGCDLLRTLELMAVHDLVEIDAGDTFAYDVDGLKDKTVRELAAADRIFSLLPEEQGRYFRGLWDEFEAQVTNESRFANALDRFQPLLQNACSEGGSWRIKPLTRAQVLERMAPVETACPGLWPTVIEVVDRFCASGLLV